VTAVKWHEGPMVSLDTESTGTDVYQDRIVTAAVVHHTPGRRPRTLSWLINPGIPIPDEAAAVHGWTTERLEARLAGAEALRIHDGREARLTRDGALFEIAAQAATAMGTETPLIIHNAPYDLTLLEAELVRNDIPGLSTRPKGGIRGVVDPMVIEKQYDPYRKSCYKAPGCDVAAKHHECGGCRGGKHKCGGCGSTDKTLTSLCAHYGVVHTGAHDAAGDALAALRLTGRLVAAWPEMARWKLATLHSHEVTWRKQQSDSLREYWRRVEDPRWAEVNSDWPIQVTQTATAGAA
jgi:DNA polymerase-3 subunit epsilon